MNFAEIKQEIVEKLSPLKPKKIIIFGSYAYGTPNADSDLDICIIKTSHNSKIEEKRKIRKALSNIKIPKDILVPDTEEYLFYKNEINSVYFDIDKRGVVLWEKE